MTAANGSRFDPELHDHFLGSFFWDHIWDRPAYSHLDFTERTAFGGNAITRLPYRT
jgi:hypothetical protein